MTTNQKRRLENEFALFQTSSILFSFIQVVKCWRNSLGLNPKGPYLSLEKEKGNRATTAKKCTKKRDARKVVVLLV